MYLNALNFGLGEDIDALRDMVRRFAADEIARSRAAHVGRAELGICRLRKRLLVKPRQCGIGLHLKLMLQGSGALSIGLNRHYPLAGRQIELHEAQVSGLIERVVGEDVLVQLNRRRMLVIVSLFNGQCLGCLDELPEHGRAALDDPGFGLVF